MRRFWIILLFPVVSMAQPSQAERDSINRLTQLDYGNMLNRLGIKSTELRPGPSGNPSAPNAANRFEDKVTQYSLPDPLTLKNGGKVKDVKIWSNLRRPEIVKDFEDEIYGHLPVKIPGVQWNVISINDTSVGNFPVKEKVLKGIVDNSECPSIKVEIELLVITPRSSTKPVPLVIEFGWISSPWNKEPIRAISNVSTAEPTWKEQLIANGWGYAIVVPTSIQADNGAGLTLGIIGLTNKGKNRMPSEWGSLRAWGWGASRVIDFLETDKDVDAKRLAIEGLSRYGKAAIVAMAFEPRLSLGFIGSSGAGGVKILRRVFGEQIENLCSSSEYHWFAGNFIKYASTLKVDDLSVDAHELVALCAPRPIFISSGSPYVEGQWLDTKGMFLAGVQAEGVYKLFGKRGLGTLDLPPLGTALTDGEIAYRQHAGGHSTGPNWSTWISWACKYWNDCELIVK